MKNTLKLMTNIVITPDNTYTVFIKSDEHPRTINTFQNQRTNFSVIEVKGGNLLKYINDCIDNNTTISEIWDGITTKITVSVDHINGLLCIAK